MQKIDYTDEASVGVILTLVNNNQIVSGTALPKCENFPNRYEVEDSYIPVAAINLLIKKGLLKYEIFEGAADDYTLLILTDKGRGILST